MIGIYLMTNKLNGKAYIGQSRNMKKRWQSHGYPSNLKPGRVLSRAISKYGLENFEFVVLEECPINNLNEREMHYISLLKPIYNMTTGGRGVVGNELSDYTKKLLSEKGRQQWERMSDAKKKEALRNLCGPRKGHEVSCDTRDKIRTALKEYYRNNSTSDLQKQRSSEANKEMVRGKQRGNKRVASVDVMTGKVVMAFDAIKIAAASVNIHPANITHVLKGQQKTAGGYGWKYLNRRSVETIPQGSTREISTLGSAEQPS